ncbi:hypothetical protein CQJ94_11400 [Glycomyces fuscus]|nr:hypothetical protein CQJ94_11400 [Glycomyces fuscus]
MLRPVRTLVPPVARDAASPVAVDGGPHRVGAGGLGCTRPGPRSGPGGPRGTGGDPLTSDHGQDHGAVLRVHSASEPTTLNPLRHEAKNLDTSVISTCVLHALNYVDADGTYRPQLLAQPPQAEDGGLTYAYRLREDRRWQDGRPVSAQDVAFTHRLMMDPGSGIPERDGYDLVEGIEIRSDTEFRLRLARPYPGFRDLFTSSTGSIMPRHLLEGTDFSSDWDTSLRPASGPFRLSEWLRGGRASGSVATPPTRTPGRGATASTSCSATMRTPRSTTSQGGAHRPAHVQRAPQEQCAQGPYLAVVHGQGHGEVRQGPGVLRLHQR